MCVTDIFKGMGAGLSVSGTVQAGSVHPGDKVIVMPQGEIATIKSMYCSEAPPPVHQIGRNESTSVSN